MVAHHREAPRFNPLTTFPGALKPRGQKKVCAGFWGSVATRGLDRVPTKRQRYGYAKIVGPRVCALARTRKQTPHRDGSPFSTFQALSKCPKGKRTVDSLTAGFGWVFEVRLSTPRLSLLFLWTLFGRRGQRRRRGRLGPAHRDAIRDPRCLRLPLVPRPAKNTP